VSAIYIREKDVTNILNIDIAIELVEEAFKGYSEGKCFNMPRRRLRIKKGALHMLPGAIPYREVFGYKAYTSFKNGVIFKVFLHSAETGELLAIIEANELGRLRTAAASAVATKYLARKDAKKHLIFGAGYQAEMQLIAVNKVRNIDEIYIVNRNAEKGEGFLNKMKDILNVKIERTSDYRAFLNKSDIITTITTSSNPLFLADDFDGCGVHINAAGSNSLIRMELPEKTIEKANILAVDAKDIADLECGDILPSLEKGRLHFNEIVELGDIISGRVKGRSDDKELTIFESHGMGIQDIICSQYIYKQALELKFYEILPF
jgi:ornithine cyclodeaminase